MVVRADTLDWSPQTVAQLLDTLERWRAAGNRLVGLQVDFDARTPPPRELRGVSEVAASVATAALPPRHHRTARLERQRRLPRP